MTKTLLATIMLSWSMWLWSMPAPQAHPTEEPKEVCYHTAPKGKKACECLGQDEGKGCKAGKRETETQICLSYCWKHKCGCCRT